MSFVVFKESILSIKHSLGVVIQGGSRRIILFISFGMKFAIIFKKKINEWFNLRIRILINVQVLKPGEFEHAPLR